MAREDFCMHRSTWALWSLNTALGWILKRLGAWERENHQTAAAVIQKRPRVAQVSVVVVQVPEEVGPFCFKDWLSLRSCQGQTSIQKGPRIPGLVSNLCVGAEKFLALKEFPYLHSRAQLTKNSRRDESEENTERTQGSHATAAAHEKVAFWVFWVSSKDRGICLSAGGVWL